MNNLDIVIENRLMRDLNRIKKENFSLFTKIMAAIDSLKSYPNFEDNYLVSKPLGKNLYELKIDQDKKYIRIFYSHKDSMIICWELLEKKSNKIPTSIIKRLRRNIKNIK